ncbi:hypothetical protein VTL71DRAFT_4884 [Oculimacula yallundae]|uniref:Uncharacterized protein n=1 Tax=Oculimacula yallundae TaxID=86028 RepID=A0ABR4C405_9HELO
MQFLSAYMALLAASSIAALPLNINLGAYSPALVVGDGEISFAGGKEAESLINTLAGASVGVDGAAAGLAGEQTPPTPAIISPAVVPVVTEALPEDNSGTPVAASLSNGLLGIGQKRDESTPVEKRDLAGFNAALNYASGALKTSPGVQLGTGHGGSGIGIIVEPGVDAAGAKPANGAPVAHSILLFLDTAPMRGAYGYFMAFNCRSSDGQYAPPLVLAETTGVSKHKPTYPQIPHVWLSTETSSDRVFSARPKQMS